MRTNARIIEWHAALAILLFCGLLGAWHQAAYGQNDARNLPVNMADSIEMVLPGDSHYDMGGWPEEGIANFSPDRRQFLTILRSGDVDANVNRYQMLLWQTADVQERKQTFRVLAVMTSATNQPVMQSVRWSKDGKNLTFIGSVKGNPHQLVRLHIKSGRIEPLTNHPTAVVDYSLNVAGDIAYLAEKPPVSLWSEKAMSDGIAVADHSDLLLTEILHGARGVGQKFGLRVMTATELFVQRGGVTKRLETLRPTAVADDAPTFQTMAISPNGAHVVVTTEVAPQALDVRWKRYDDYGIQSAFEYLGDPRRSILNGRGTNQHSWVQQYEILDTTSGKSKILLPSPVGPTGRWNSRPLWSPDSASVILNAIYPAIDPAKPEPAPGSVRQLLSR